MDRDLALAGIPKRDTRGWTVDVHALRHTFGTLLSKGNVAPRTAQAAMRHSSLDLTMNVYTDPQLLDVAGALERLPELAVYGTLGAERRTVQVAGAWAKSPYAHMLVMSSARPDAAFRSAGCCGHCWREAA
jgi:hypothetical protein